MHAQLSLTVSKVALAGGEGSDRDKYVPPMATYGDLSKPFTQPIPLHQNAIFTLGPSAVPSLPRTTTPPPSGSSWLLCLGYLGETFASDQGI